MIPRLQGADNAARPVGLAAVHLWTTLMQERNLVAPLTVWLI